MPSNLSENCGSEPLQLILGTDKRNPLVSVFAKDETQTLHVYYGLELMEVIPAERKHPSFKLLVARLYNAGLKVCVLSETFDVDRKTMKRWADALLEGDPEKLIAVLSGRKGKITAEIEGFVRMRFASVYREHPQNYSSYIRGEISEIFEVSLSGEALRPLFGELRAALSRKTSEPKRELACEGAPLDPSGESTAQIPDTEAPAEAPTLASDTQCPSSDDLVTSTIRKQSPAFFAIPEGGCRFCHHAGVLLFSSALAEFDQNFPPETGPMLKQWLASVLLGAINIEQSKFLDFDDLDVLLGSSTRRLHPQRLRLAEMGRGQTAEELLRLNAAQCGAGEETDFYYDPHTKQYTGAARILKGWCGSIKRADKALHTDFIHDHHGNPLYLQWADNYHDLRERFLPNIEHFRKLAKIEPDWVLTITVDRGIYGMEVFKEVLAQKNLHLITWEKDYRPGAWPVELPTKTFVLQRSRNRALDLRSYRFEYLERPWEKNPAMRQILVRATNPAGRTVEVSVLSDDPDRCPQQIIRMIFWRWVQENDFKYLDKHFGINQITSYAVLDYAGLAEKIEDKQMKNGERLALVREKGNLKKELGRLLVDQRAYLQKKEQKEQKAKEKENKKRKTPAGDKREKARRARIIGIDQRSLEIDALIQSTDKEVSRLEKLIAENKQRLDTASKSVMDGVKVIARNAFYRAFAPFKLAYDNYRDDHDYFRKLTQSHGLLVNRSGRLEVHLITPVNFPPKIQRIVDKLLGEINQQKLLLPDGSGRVIQFSLGQKAGIQLASQSPATTPF